MKPTRVLFVCHGNICRSPMAEMIFRALVKAENREKDFLIASAATSTEEIRNGIGNPVYPPAIYELERHHIPCTDHRATQMTKADYKTYDLLIGMDSANVRNMLRIAGGDPEHKIHKLMDYTPRGGDVAEPWYSDRFDIAFKDIYDGCEALLQGLQT